MSSDLGLGNHSHDYVWLQRNHTDLGDVLEIVCHDAVNGRTLADDNSIEKCPDKVNILRDQPLPLMGNDSRLERRGCSEGWIEIW